MSRNRRSPLTLAAVLGVFALSGCDSVQSLPSISEMIPTLPTIPILGALPDDLIDLQFWKDRACAEVNDDDVKRVNWTRVPEVNMRIRAGEFEPMIVQMKQGWPYVFRIRNRDDAAHTFTSRDFFANMAMIRITVDGKRRNDTCITKIKIPAKKSVEMRLVAAVDGRFEFEDRTGPITSLVLPKGASGVIIVEEGFATRYR